MIETSPTIRSGPQPAVEAHYDVIVVGGGPAGSTVSALLAEQGDRTLVLERELFPRFHVGESLVPETYWVFQRLGLLDQLRRSAFPKKFSVQFVNEAGKESAPFYFNEHKCHESSQTWQVVRGPFDKMLLDNATEKGATVRTDAQVMDVLFDGDRAVGVRAMLGADSDRSVRDISASVVVDASGQSAFLANRLGLKTPDPRLRKGAVWGYFRGAHRDCGIDEGATIILQTAGKKSWFWYIPLLDNVASIGCTGNLEDLFGPEHGTLEEIFETERQRCPGIVRRLKSATRITDFFVTKDFSYQTRQSAGPGWVLVGDANGFIDPVYSSGVFLALKSGEFAADAIHAAVFDHDVSAERLGCWRERYLGGAELFRKLVYAFYTPGFSFGQFLRKFPQYHGALVDILIGDVFKPGLDEMFQAMEETVTFDC